MPSLLRLLACAIACCLLALTPAADAQQSDPVRELFKRGTKALQEGDFATAERLLSQAYAQRQAPDIAGNLGYAELMNKKYRQAAEHLDFAVNNPLGRTKPEQAKFIKEQRDAAFRHVAVLQLSSSTPCKVVLNEQSLEVLANQRTTLYLDAGNHSLTATATGHETLKLHLDLAKGTQTERILELVPVAEPPGTSPLVVVGAVFAGAGAVLGGTAIGLAVAANGKDSDIAALTTTVSDGGANCNAPEASLTQPCTDLANAFESRDSLNNAALGVGVAGGLSLVVGAALIIMGVTTDTPEPSTTFVPAIAPHVGGFALQHNF